MDSITFCHRRIRTARQEPFQFEISAFNSPFSMGARLSWNSDSSEQHAELRRPIALGEQLDIRQDLPEFDFHFETRRSWRLIDASASARRALSIHYFSYFKGRHRYSMFLVSTEVAISALCSGCVVWSVVIRATDSELAEFSIGGPYGSLDMVARNVPARACRLGLCYLFLIGCENI